jgi:hypothetical protein
MKKGKVFFHPIEGTGALTISWTSGPKGDAVEAKKGSGVGFFSDSGHLLCVIFDEVQALEDRQSLEFDQFCVEIQVKKGKVTHSMTHLGVTKKPRSNRSRRKKSKQRDYSKNRP